MRRLVVLAGLWFAGANCTPAPAPVPPVNVTLRITTSRGAAVSGAEVVVGNSVLARSDTSGTASVDVGGREGDSFAIEVRCPAPLRSPNQPIVIRRLAIAGGQTEHAVKCEETRRTLVVVVRADNGADLPILHLGREVGRTDASGAAHVKLEADVTERVELTLSTAGEEGKGLHPQNPAMAFEPAEGDEVKEFAIAFTRDAKRKPPKVVRKGPQVF